MRTVLQRVSEASVAVDGETLSTIGPGLLILLGIEEDDGGEDIDWLCRKIARMRIFPDDEGKMNRALTDTAEPAAIVISQFTLHASTRRGNRPSFLRAAGPDIAEPLYERFREALAAEIGRPVGAGRFGADMKVALVNDGPVTITLDSKARE